MYRNTNTNQALRDIGSMLTSMPEQKSMRGLRSAQSEEANLRAMADLERERLARPGLQLQSNKDQAQLDIENSPVHASQLFGNVGGDLGRAGYALTNTPGQGVMWSQDQKEIPGVGPVPPAIIQAMDNIKGRYGAAINNDGILVDKTGQPIPNYKAGQIFNEVRRVKLLNMDPIKARDERAMLLESAIGSGRLSDQDIKVAQQELDQLKNTDEITIREAYLNRLNQYKAEDEQYGRRSRLMDPMIQEQVAKIGELKGAAAEASKRQFEKEKISLQNKGRIDAARVKEGGKADPFTNARLKDISASIAKIDEIIAGGMIDLGYGEKVEMVPEDTARLLAQRAALIGEAQYLQSGGTPSASSVKEPEKPAGKKLTKAIAVEYLNAANGDKDIARKLAREDGMLF